MLVHQDSYEWVKLWEVECPRNRNGLIQRSTSEGGVTVFIGRVGNGDRSLHVEIEQDSKSIFRGYSQSEMLLLLTGGLMAHGDLYSRIHGVFECTRKN